MFTSSEDFEAKNFLLVCCKTEDTVQQVLELALHANAIPYAYEGQNDAFVFDKSMDNFESFEENLANLDVATATIPYSL